LWQWAPSPEAAPCPTRIGASSSGADTRSRWKARRVVVVDLGDRVVMRPLPDDAIEGLEGKYRKEGPTTDQARRRARREGTDPAARR